MTPDYQIDYKPWRSYRFFRLNIQTVLNREEEIARQCIRIRHCATRCRDGVVDVRQFVEHVETVDHKHPAAETLRRIRNSDIPDRICRVKIVDSITVAAVAGKISANAEAFRQFEIAAHTIVEVSRINRVEALAVRRSVTAVEIGAELQCLRP